MKAVKLFALILTLAFLLGCWDDNNATPGGNTFVANGGNAAMTSGTGYSGGAGGSINFGYYGPGYYPIWGDVSVTSSGTLDTSFTLPVVTPVYGSNVLTISTNTTAALNGSCTITPPATTYGYAVYLNSSDTNLYYCDPTNGSTIASDLIVQAGTTLTLPSNNGTMGNYGGGTSSAQISLANTVTINGTVNTAADGVQLSISAGGNLLQIGPNGTVTTKSATAGTDGSYIYLYSGGIATNKGTIDTSGNSTTAAATDGSAGGGVDFEADTYLYNTGTILARGGSSAYGNGGKGRHIHLYAYSADLDNSGTIDNSGGNGAMTGGDGGYNIRLYAGADSHSEGGVGNLIASGSVLSNGGNGGTGNGGGGGYIYSESFGGKLWSNAIIGLNGGSSIATNGGTAGEFDLYGEYYADGEYVDTNGIKLSGTINMSGGNGATGGGSGGYLYFDNYVDYSGEGEAYGYLPSPAVAMVGFSSLTMNGGTGDIGGEGGEYWIFDLPYYSYDMDLPVFGGLILSQVPVSATGGAGTTTGGAGGGIFLNAPYIFTFPDFFEFSGPYTIASTSFTTSNLADVNVSGGSGATGGVGGVAWMAGLGTVLNSGVINANAGAGTVTGGNGYTSAPWGAVALLSLFDVVNSGNINASGGNGGAAGGYGGGVWLDAGGQTQNSASITVAGGNGTTTGGNGGEIFMDSYELGPTIANLPGLSVAGGTGPTPGANGTIDIPY